MQLAEVPQGEVVHWVVPAQARRRDWGRGVGNWGKAATAAFDGRTRAPLQVNIGPRDYLLLFPVPPHEGYGATQLHGRAQAAFVQRAVHTIGNNLLCLNLSGRARWPRFPLARRSAWWDPMPQPKGPQAALASFATSPCSLSPRLRSRAPA